MWKRESRKQTKQGHPDRERHGTNLSAAFGQIRNILSATKLLETVKTHFPRLQEKVIRAFRRMSIRNLHRPLKQQGSSAFRWKLSASFREHLEALTAAAGYLTTNRNELIKKFALAVACIVFMAGLVIWTRRNIQNFERETIAKVNRYMSGVAREKAQCLEKSIQEMQEYISLLARKPFSGEFQVGQPLPYNDYLAGEALLDHVGGRVDSIYRIDKRGKVLHRVPYEQGCIGRDYAGTPGISFVLENHEPYLSEVFDIYPGVPGFSLSQPVFDDDHFMGVICFLISLQTLNESVCHIQNGAAGSVWVINKGGSILSHSNPGVIGRNILDVERQTSDALDWSEFEQIIGRMMSGEEGQGVYHSVTSRGEKAVIVKKAAAFVPIDLHDQTWSLAITMDYGEIANPVKTHTRNNFLVASFVMLIFGVGGIIYYRNQKKKAELELIARSAKELQISNEKLRQEIEQRIQAEQAREESENNYRLLAENVMDVIWIADLNFRIVYISPSVKRVLGMDPHKAVGQSIEQVLTPTSLETAKDVLAEEVALANHQGPDESRDRTLDLELYRNDKSTIWAETKISFLYDDNDTLAGLLGVTRDITEKMQLQHQFFQAQKMESIGTLAGGIAHDFNNLLGGIMGYASLMKSEFEEDRMFFRYAETIEKSAKRAGELTSQLLAFARGGKYEPKIVNLNNIVEETLELIERTFDKSIEIDVHLGESIPTVEADAGQMQQVIMNLCVNARDAMDNAGKLTIETREETVASQQTGEQMEMEPGSYVVLSIADTGMGMDDRTLKRIFEPFYTTKEKGKGTGLGLAMVYGVMKNHGGHVNVSTEPGVGTTFDIYIPASGKPATTETGTKRLIRGKKEQILVVDDEEIARSLAKDVLESYGYQVILAENGVEALDIYRERKESLSLVLIDMVMPKMGGRETFLKLKELNEKVRAILITGYSRNEEANEILRSGVMGFIQKPFQLEELLSKVRAVLDSKSVA
jgi:PAS domain S-box-containing protein